MITETDAEEYGRIVVWCNYPNEVLISCIPLEHPMQMQHKADVLGLFYVVSSMVEHEGGSIILQILVVTYTVE